MKKDSALVSTKEFINEVLKTFYKFDKNNIISKHPAIFIEGQPGVGKSQSIIQLKELLSLKTNKKVNVVDIRLILFNPIDLRGIPVPNIDDKVAIWLRPLIFDLDSSDDVINILFLDELTSAPQSVQAAAYQIALDRRLGEHELPNNTFIIAAGNRIEDGSVTYPMPAALKNRFIHFEMVTNFKDWLDWATENNINEEIITFLKTHPKKLSTNEFETDSNIIVTPRTWEILSTMLKVVGGTVKENEIMVNSIIGKGLTNLFLAKGPEHLFEQIIGGEKQERPNTMDELEQSISVLNVRMDEYIYSQYKTVNVLRYLILLPVEYSVRVFKQIINREIKDYNLLDVKEYVELVNIIGNTYEE